MEIRENVILAPYTTFRIGGPARYFCEVTSIEDLKRALQFSKENNLHFFILGLGSNILVSDKGFGGLVIKMGIKGLEFKEGNEGSIMSAGAGENWDEVIAASVERGHSGIENLSLIPGTAGAAVYQNIGAYGVELKDVLESAKVLDIGSGEIKTYSNKDCKFGYRNSVFKTNKKQDLIILKINLRLLKNNEPNLNYPDLAKMFEGKKPSALEVRNAVIEIRKNKLPYPAEVGNAGSFFKNPTIKTSNFQFLISKHPDLKGFDQGDGTVKLSAAELIEKCGWKGKTRGNVGVSGKHALVLVNYGKGTEEEILDLAKEIKNVVRDQFGMELEPEVEVVGGA
ncbi:MAG: UDP-N-acetylmuramate dehydrogenase [Patescibacteria group bacterium]